MIEKFDSKTIIQFNQRDGIDLWQNYPHWAWDKPSLAIIASNGVDGVVLWTAGPALRFKMEEGGLRYLSDLGLDDAPQGISVWEGKYFWHPGFYEYPADGESEAIGIFRELTEVEWKAVKEDRCPWNENEWHEQGDNEKR